MALKLPETLKIILMRLKSVKWREWLSYGHEKIKGITWKMLLNNVHTPTMVSKQRYTVFQVLTLTGIIACIATAFQYYFLLEASHGIPTYVTELSVFLLLNFLALQWHKNKFAAYCAALIGTLFIIHITTYYAGGITNPGLLFLAALILGAFFLLGPKWGRLSLLISLADLLYFYFEDKSAFVKLMPDEYDDINFLLSLTISFTVIAVFSYALEVTKNRAIRDAAEANRLLQQSLSQVEKFSTALSQTDSSVMITDKLGRIEWVNKGFEKLTGFILEDVWGTYGEILRKGLKTGFSDSNVYRVCIDEKKTIHYVEKNYHKNGKEYWVATTLTPVFDEEGKLQNLIAIDTDITERKIMEEELLRAMNIAEESLANQQELMNVVSREIRTPLLSMVGLADKLMNASMKEEHQALVQTIRMSAKTLDLTLNDVLAYAKYKTKSEMLKLSQFDLSKEIKDALPAMEEKAKAKKLILNYHYQFNNHQVVEADREVLLQVFNNFVDTAISFTDRGMIEMNISELQSNGKVSLMKVQLQNVANGTSEARKKLLAAHFTGLNKSVVQPHQYNSLGIDISNKLIKLIGGATGIQKQDDDTFELWFTFSVRLKKEAAVSRQP